MFKPFHFGITGGQYSALAASKDTEVEEYDYAYYDDTTLDSPFVNPHDPTHYQPQLLAGNLAGHLASARAAAPITSPRPSVGPTTPRPLRIFPSVNLQLERFRNGFNFGFESQ